ncbi:MAPEG family protein [Sphingomonas sp. I4]
MAAALVVVMLTLLVGWGIGHPLSPTDRLLRAVAASTVAALWLAATIGHVAALRFEIARRHRRGGRPQPRFTAYHHRAGGIAQHAGAGGAGDSRLSGAGLGGGGSGALIPLLAALFSVGRTLFWANYARGAVARAFGFALGFYSSVAALVIVLVALVGRLI